MNDEEKKKDVPNESEANEPVPTIDELCDTYCREGGKWPNL
jgi:hypothetical protein